VEEGDLGIERGLPSRENNMSGSNEEKESSCPAGFIWIGGSLINTAHIVHIEPGDGRASAAALIMSNGDKILCTESSVMDFAKAIGAALGWA
jgi:hypothetical protein